MSLENIFNAPDIKKQLPDDSYKFSKLDRFWSDLMLRIKK